MSPSQEGGSHRERAETQRTGHRPIPVPRVKSPTTVNHMVVEDGVCEHTVGVVRDLWICCYDTQSCLITRSPSLRHTP